MSIILHGTRDIARCRGQPNANSPRLDRHFHNTWRAPTGIVTFRGTVEAMTACEPPCPRMGRSRRPCIFQPGLMFAAARLLSSLFARDALPDRADFAPSRRVPVRARRARGASEVVMIVAGTRPE